MQSVNGFNLVSVDASHLTISKTKSSRQSSHRSVYKKNLILTFFISFISFNLAFAALYRKNAFVTRIVLLVHLLWSSLSVFQLYLKNNTGRYFFCIPPICFYLLDSQIVCFQSNFVFHSILLSHPSVFHKNINYDN